MIAALLLIVAGAQDLESEAARLRDEGRYVEALAVLGDLEDPARAGLQRALLLWGAGDLGGALLAGLDGLAAGGDAETRRQLLWRCTDLALELGEAALALDLVTRWEEAVAGAGDLDAGQKQQWTNGWGPGTGTRLSRQRAEELGTRLDDAEGGVARARLVAWLLGLAVMGGMLAAGRRAHQGSSPLKN